MAIQNTPYTLVLCRKYMPCFAVFAGILMLKEHTFHGLLDVEFIALSLCYGFHQYVEQKKIYWAADYGFSVLLP